MQNKILIYGASGYTGQLVLEALEKENLDIIVAARKDFKAVFTKRIFSLNNQSEIIRNLADVKLLVNIAGPFPLTNKPLIEACLKTKTHYIDMSGEYKAFQMVYGYHEQALEAGIMLMPGVGFGIVPTDIAAHIVSKKISNPTDLEIIFITVGGASTGTLNAVLKGIENAGVQRVEGKLIEQKPGIETKEVIHSSEKFSVVTNPWRADVFSAFYSTNIPNIKVFSNFPSFVIKFMQGKNLWLRNLLLKRISPLLPKGPSAKQRSKGKTLVCVTAKSNSNSVTAIIEGPEAYNFTTLTTVEIIKKVSTNNFKSGFQTPSIYGEELIANFCNIIVN